MIARITFLDTKNQEKHVMLFGDNYKKWQIHYDDYTRMFKHLLPVKFETCVTRWTGFGLKWCSEENIQSELDAVAKEDVRARGRIYSTFHFHEQPLAKLPK